MLWTQGRDEDTTYWPVRQVVVCTSIPNTIDDQGMAVQAQLSCGHVTILTGEHVSLEELPCRICGLQLPVRKKRRRLW